MINIGISYGLLHDTLSELITSWRRLALDKVHSAQCNYPTQLKAFGTGRGKHAGTVLRKVQRHFSPVNHRSPALPCKHCQETRCGFIQRHAQVRLSNGEWLAGLSSLVKVPEFASPVNSLREVHSVRQATSTGYRRCTDGVESNFRELQLYSLDLGRFECILRRP
jgi:hypothetical protein